MEYNFRAIEQKWQQHWKDSETYKVPNNSPKPKFYVLDMFPYPSGAGLHVGHPLGYIASDIYARFKRLKGFNVLHPMGYDSFGLPAEQYAIETGQHPATTTEKNIATFRSQLDKIGFCYDWSREVRTSDPKYYKWTQWLFLQLYNSYFCNTEQKALPIEKLAHKYATKGAMPKTGDTIPGTHFTADEWNSYSTAQQEEILAKRRLAFSAYGEVNWCEALGTVLANDEVVNGVSERGGHPVEKKKMRQWYLRITAYADRLLEGLDRVDFSDAMKEMQKNWIGRSQGAEIEFRLTTQGGAGSQTEIATSQGEALTLKVYTTRPDTIFGVDFMVIAPEHELVAQITTAEQREEIEKYLTYVKSRSERERMADVKQITGCFTGAYALNPFDGRQIPVWIAEYVLAGYGTGAIMAVPCGDQRDFGFAKYFNIPITNIIGAHYNGEEANATKEAILENSGFLNGMVMKDAMGVAIDKLEEMGIGKRKVNYRMRDAGFSRQRYWGEPFPIVWKDGVAIALDEKDLPLQLPHVDTYGPGPEGEGPLANIPSFVETPNGLRETSTMPGYAGSSWYFLRYMDPQNDQTFCDRTVSDYWNQVDLYIGGTEHAVGHLLYSRMWTKVMYDLGLIGFDEPFKKLMNQGMITGVSEFAGQAYILFEDEDVSYDSPERIAYIKDNGEIDTINIESGNKQYKKFLYSRKMYEKLSNEITKRNGREINTLRLRSVGDHGQRLLIKYVNNHEFDVLSYLEDFPNANDSVYITEAGYYIDGVFNSFKDSTAENKFYTYPLVEKMSKSKLNVENPDDIINKYGADTFRMYEMFLGPVEMSKPWDTKGIEGVHRFLRKLWRLFFDELKGKVWNEEKATDAELKVLHRTIKKIEGDTESFAFNTAVSSFMICVNDLTDLKCNKKEILSPLLVLLTPYAPHIAEELWSALENSGSVLDAAYPVFDGKYLVEAEKEYPISINGKMRTTINIATNAEEAEVKEIVLANEVVQKWLEGNDPKKIIFVKNKMVNVVV